MNYGTIELEHSTTVQVKTGGVRTDLRSEHLPVRPPPLPALLLFKEPSDVVGRHHLTGNREVT
jgi:hypothetical protein